MRKLYEHYGPKETPPYPLQRGDTPWVILSGGDILVEATDVERTADIAKVLDSLDAYSLLRDLKRRVSCVSRDIARLQDEIQDILKGD